MPFLQMRLALGDVVHIDSRGYAGAVTRPSGRVTFAARRTDPASESPDFRGEFPGAVVEHLGGGRFAIAASSAAEADRIRTRLQSWEQEGHLECRSILRFDRADTPLL